MGSITTPKPEPKDLDLLVWIDDAMDLAPLARTAYLGRVCIWTRCAPGVRVRCDAQHCGQRQFLHDDLQTIRLPTDLIREPPAELWPQVVVRRAIPADLMAFLQRLS